jgi:hypothetical protein
MNRYTYIIFLLLLYFTKGMAQTTYPVQVNVNLLPPYSLYLSDYYSSTREKIVVTLINRDQFKPTLSVRLRMIITAPGGIRIQTNPNAFIEPVSVETGSPVRLTQDDLAPYFLPNNLITQGYLAAGKLPEGMVEFCFQAVEAFTGQVLSASTCARAWVTSQKPPLLSLPRNTESIAFREPLNVLFQWTPLHRGLALVEYDFILKELWDNGMTVQAAFPYSPEIYRETTRSTSLLYGAMQPPLIPGKRYAWCIRAKAREGLDEVNLFQNDGYSEIRSFTLQDNCLPLQYVTATAERKRLNLEWNTLPEYIGFTVSYRLKNSASSLSSGEGRGEAEWREQQTQDPKAIVYGLQNGGTYEYRVGSICMAGQPIYSPVFSITLPQEDSARLAHCGILPAVSLTNQEPIKELKTGEEFKAGDFPITIVSIKGSNGTFSGHGWTIIPWLNDAKIAVEFRDITINTDKQMINGYVEAMYGKTEGQIGNLDDVFEGGFDQGIVKTGLTKTDYKFDFSIPGVDAFELNESGDLVITDNEGTPHTLSVHPPLSSGEGLGVRSVFPMTVQDKDGNVYLVEKVPDPNDNTKEIAKATKLGNVGSPLPEGSFDPTQLNGDKAIVRFNKGNGKYAFDTWEEYYDKISLIKGKYQQLYTNYYAPWKLLPAGESDEISATIEITDKDIDPAKVIFTTPKGTRYDAEYSKNTYALKITSGPEGDVQELYALYPKDSGTYYTLGKIGIATYQPQVHKVVLVSVEGAVIETDIEQKLKDIYRPVGITWQVEREQFAYSDTTRLMQNSTGLSTYNEAMRTLNNAYRAANTNFDKEANYLFFLKATGSADINNRDLTGFMPRGAQFGSIFTSEIKNADEAQVVAHELGHGRWKLYHPFDKHYGGFDDARITENIMSYKTTANHFAKWQWDQIYDPAMLVSVFEGDEKSAYSSSEYFTKLLQQIRCAYISKLDVLDMPERYRSGGNKEDVGLVYGLPTAQTEINGLKLTRAWWTATASATKITGVLNPLVDPHTGDIKFGNFSIKVPVEVYNMNSGITPFEHFRRYLFPTESYVISEFNKVWDDGIKQKIESDQNLSSEDIAKLKTIASCETRYLDVDSRYKLIQAVMNYSTREYYEDLILDVMQTTPSGIKSKELFSKINSNKKLLDELMTTMDNYGGEEKNFDRLAKEFYALFTKGYSKDELKTKYASIPENRRLFFYGFGLICEWSISVERKFDVMIFEEKQVSNVQYRSYIPTQDGSSLPTCDVTLEEYEIGIQELVAVRFVGDNFLVKENEAVVLPASVYYILVKSHWNEQYYQMANASWVAIGIVTPIDEFYLLGKAIQYGTKGFRALRLTKVKFFAKTRKIEVPLNDGGVKLKEESLGKLDEYVEWSATVAGNWQKIHTKLDNLELPNLKLKLNGLDESAKTRFADDVVNLTDDALKQLEDNFGLLDEWKQIDALSASAQASRKPAWLQKIIDGNEFNRIRSSSYPNNEVYLVNPNDASKYVRLDSYKPGQEIVSRKYTQFSEIQESTGIKYIQELKDKYPSGVAKIADVPSNKIGGANSALQGQISQPVTGQMILEIPVQKNGIHQSVLTEANKWGIKIRDVQGKIY